MQDELLAEIAERDFFGSTRNEQVEHNYYSTNVMPNNLFPNFEERMYCSGTLILAYLRKSNRTVPSAIASQLILTKPNLAFSQKGKQSACGYTMLN